MVIIYLFLSGFTKKSVTVGKLSKKSFNWDQSGISSFFCSKVIGKTRWVVKKMAEFNNLYQKEVRNVKISQPIFSFLVRNCSEIHK